MRIIGHGIDLLDLETFHLLSSADLLRHWERVFTSVELAEAGPPDGLRYVERLGGKFALKEAVYKACGGTRDGEIDWAEIEVTRTPLGEPSIRLWGEMQKNCVASGITGWLVSIAHTKTHAMGSAITAQTC
jgi:holo-[acyl-carrier protein] synthase